MLDKHRCNGEWFDVPPEIAVAAIAGAAHKLGQPILPVTLDVSDQILSGGGPDGEASAANTIKRDLVMSLVIAAAWYALIYHYILS